MAAIRYALAAIWIYQGLVPKLLGPHADELAMNLALGVSTASATTISYLAGVSEIAMGLAVAYLPRQRWPLWGTIVLMPLLAVYAAWAMPRLYAAAFNPATINLAMAAMAWTLLRATPNDAQAPSVPS